MRATAYAVGTNPVLLAAQGYEGTPITITQLADGRVFAIYRWDEVKQIRVAVFDSIEDYLVCNCPLKVPIAIVRMLTFGSQRYRHVLDDQELALVLELRRDDDDLLPERWELWLAGYVEREGRAMDARATP